MKKHKAIQIRFQHFLFIIINLFIASFSLQAQPIVVKADKPTAAIQPTMWGIFFEDINLAADGGIYAELVKNRSFEFAAPMMGWKIQQSSPATGSVLVTNRLETDSSNPRYVRVSRNTDAGNFGLTNEGFRGMGIKQNEQYNFSVWANPSR